MKKLLLALGIASVLSAPAMADDTLDAGSQPISKEFGLLSFNGNIISETCQLSADSQFQTVTLPTISLNTFKLGSDKGRTPFEIKVENCTGDSEADISVGFFPVVDSLSAEGYLLNKDDAGASDIGFMLLENEDEASPILLKNPIGKQNVPFIGADFNPTHSPAITDDESEIGAEFEHSFQFAVEYAPTGKNPTAGSVKATLPFSIIYQ